ncbi:histidine triad (HIT) family protein [Mesorhizobium sp. J18]|uniref:HIT family protein n=1 Tax=Mesorhizobium sp. J18 TaxID=935263 RepID=UPI00119B169C|nr:HIT family protein [Mesorhizobium sp. J18]TWG93314.1 histidine triad (HIT) family protein [Mesorhizobium sp. J18]
MKNFHNHRCVFCAIASREVEAGIVHEDDGIVAFLDVHPIRPGHIQIIPREHYRWFDELPPELASHILLTGQRLARILKEIYEVERVGFLFTGGDVPHAHAHLVPLVAKDDITSRRYIVEQKVTYRDTPLIPNEELQQTAKRLRAQLQT